MCSFIGLTFSISVLILQNTLVSLNGHSLERTSLYKGHKHLAAGTGENMIRETEEYFQKNTHAIDGNAFYWFKKKRDTKLEISNQKLLHTNTLYTYRVQSNSKLL